MACFINNLVCKYIFGGMIMLVIFMGLARSASYPKEKTSVEKWGMLQDLLVGIGLSVYLIYIIPDNDLRTIITAIVAALYGGLLTLVGVFSTIKHSDKMFLMENKLKNKPILVVVQDHARESDLPTRGRHAAIKEDEKKGFDIQFLVKNIANNPAKIKSIFYKSREYNFPNEHLWVEGQEQLWVCFQTDGFFYGDEFGLIVEDVLNNQYNYSFKTNDVALVCLMKETENGKQLLPYYE